MNTHVSLTTSLLSPFGFRTQDILNMASQKDKTRIGVTQPESVGVLGRDWLGFTLELDRTEEDSERFPILGLWWVIPKVHSLPECNAHTQTLIRKFEKLLWLRVKKITHDCAAIWRTPSRLLPVVVVVGVQHSCG